MTPTIAPGRDACAELTAPRSGGGDAGDRAGGDFGAPVLVWYRPRPPSPTAPGGGSRLRLRGAAANSARLGERRYWCGTEIATPYGASWAAAVTSPVATAARAPERGRAGDADQPNVAHLAEGCWPACRNSRGDPPRGDPVLQKVATAVPHQYRASMVPHRHHTGAAPRWHRFGVVLVWYLRAP